MQILYDVGMYKTLNLCSRPIFWIFNEFQFLNLISLCKNWAWDLEHKIWNFEGLWTFLVLHRWDKMYQKLYKSEFISSSSVKRICYAKIHANSINFIVRSINACIINFDIKTNNWMIENKKSIYSRYL